MFQNLLVTTDTNRVSCQNEACDVRQINAVLPGFFSYSVTSVGGPGNFENSGLRLYRVCAPSAIRSSIELIIKQTAKVNSVNIRFKIPLYSNLDLDCPAVSSQQIYENDCTTLSTAFENSNNLIPSLQNGFLYANLADITTPKTYSFCLKITAIPNSITVPNLEFVLEADCSSAFSRVNDTFIPIFEMFNSTLELKTLLNISSIIINSDKLYCPITSVVIHSEGCKARYPGNVLSLNKTNNNLLARTNSTDPVDQAICLVVSNKD